MASVNKVILIGNIGKDPEIRYMPSGDAMVNLTLATTDNWKDKNGEKQERTEWHRVAIFGKLAEIAGEYLKKGSQVYFEGSLKTRKWTNKEGHDQYTTEIIADKMQMLGGRGGSASMDSSSQSEPKPARSSAPTQPASQSPAGGNHFDDLDDDIPF